MSPANEDDRYRNERFIRKKLRTLFETAQEQSGHQGLADKCKKFYQKCGDTPMFLDEFITILRYCFVYSEKTAVERMLSFAAKFIVMLYCKNDNISDSLDDDEEDVSNEDPLITGILGFLYKSHGAASVDARLRCVTLLNKILSSMPENSIISDDMWSKLSETVLSRIQDKSPAVRVEAVLTARKLQNPKNADCEIMQALVFHLNDPSSAVRRVVVSSIALNKTTIGYVLGRTRDVNDNVRRNAYIVFSKVKVLNLTIKYRTTILDRGLQDRSEMVRECVRKLVVVHWLENFNNDIIKFLESLDVVNGAEIGILVLEAIFKTMPMSDILKYLPLTEETKLIARDKLSPETAILWRCLVHFFHKENQEDELEEILPDLTTFCNYIKDFYPLEKNIDSELNQDEQWEEVKQKQILLHLLHIAKVFDLSDEMGRLNLKKLITTMLTSYRISGNISDCLIELVALVIPSSDQFMQEITEVISEVKEPLNQVSEPIPRHKKIELELKISDLKVTLNDLKEREYNAVQNKQYVEAQNLKDEIEDIVSQLEELQSQPVAVPNEVREERNDPITLCKCLSMLIQMIKCSTVKSLTPTLRSLKDNFLNQCLTSHDLLTQSLAIQALGQFCILDKELAKENLFRFMLMISENADNEINIPAIKCIFDIIHTYGIESFENLDETQNLTSSRSKSRTLLIENEDFLNESIQEMQADATLSGAKCISMLKELLNCKSNDGIRMIVYEGLCKLLLSGVVYSSSVLSKIIIKGFTPIIENESEDFIRQVFIMFFPIFASTTPRSQEMIESAFIPTMKVIMNASLGSPEADIHPKDVLTFLIEHTKPDVNKYTSKTLHVHNNLALSICNEILHDTFDDHNMVIIFFRALLHLDISSDESILQQLSTLKSKLEEKFEGYSGFPRYLKELGKVLDDKAQTTLQSVENTLATTNSDARTTKGTVNDTTNPTRASGASGSDINSTLTTAATRNSSVSTVRTTRGSKRRRTTQDDLSIVNETLESTQILESNESFSTPGSTCSHKKGPTGKIVPESPEISDESS